MEQFAKASKFMPLKDSDFFIFGKACYKSEAYNRAAEIFEELIKKDNEIIDVYSWLGNTLCHIDTADNYPSAKPYFEMFIKKTGTDTLNRQQKLLGAYHYLISYHLYQKPPHNDSVIIFSHKLLEQSTCNSNFQNIANIGLAIAYKNENDLKNAEFYSSKALELEPANKSIKEFNRSIIERRKKLSWDLWYNKMKSDSIFSSMKKSIDNAYEVGFSQEFIPKVLIDTLQFWNKYFLLTSTGKQSTKAERQIVFVLTNAENSFIIYQNYYYPDSIHIIWAQFSNSQIQYIWTGIGPKKIGNIESFKNFIKKSNNSSLYPKFL